MIAELRGPKLFDGYRGKPAADKEALARTLVAASQMAAALAPRLKEPDINPLFVGPDGVVAADALLVFGSDPAGLTGLTHSANRRWSAAIARAALEPRCQTRGSDTYATPAR